MTLRLLFIFTLKLLPLLVFSQGIRDSIFELPQVEVNADRIFQKESAGMKETLIDTIILQQKLNLSLSELLSENTPVFIKSHGRGALASASFRGTAPSHTQVTWNGISINTPMAGMVDFSLIPVYIIDDVSLKHGTASIADRNGGLGGSINISNRADWDNTFHARYTQGIGSYSTFDEYLQLGLGNRKVQWRTRVYHNQSKNNYRFINRLKTQNQDGVWVNPPDTNRNAAYTRYGILQEVYLQPAADNIVSVKWWSQWADRSIPQAISNEGPQNYNSANFNNQTDTDHRLVADWNYYTGKGKYVVRTGYTARQLDYVLRNQISGLGLMPVVYSESNQKSFLNHASYAQNITDNFSIESSFDINYHTVLSKDSVIRTGYERNRMEYSLFVGARQNIGKKLNLNVMLRQDWYDNSPAPFIPFFGLDFKPWNKHHFIIKANIARNFNQPSLNDMYWQPGGNAELLPEKGSGAEAGIVYQILIRKIMITSEATFYHSDIKNWIIWVPGLKGYWEPDNIRRVLTQGVETNIRFRGEFRELVWRMNATYAYTRALNYGDPLVWGDESYGKQLVFIPLHSGNAFFHLAYRGYSFSWQHNSYSRQYVTTGNDKSRRKWFYPYYMNDLAIGKQFQVKSFELHAEFKVYNLFDETYHSVLYRPMPGRNFMVLLRVGV